MKAEQDSHMVAADPITLKVASLFDALSETYDSVGVDFFQPIAASLVRAMTPIKGESWLDIGCGRGAVIDQIVEPIGSDGKILGTDISPGMIEQLQRHVTQKHYSNVTLKVDDAQNPNLETQNFNTISSSLVLFFLPNPQRALQQWLHLLTPGGRIGVTTFAEQDPRWVQVDSVLQPFKTASMKDARTSGASGPFESDAGMEDLLSSAGFGKVRTITDRIPVRFNSPSHWFDFSWSVGARQMWLLVPEADRPAVRAEGERRLREIVEPDGSILTFQGIRHTLGESPKTL
jgi:ubiquinone/menaquinone biosynthesis C-methylase UbiE